jgi:hypothetical protein
MAVIVDIPTNAVHAAADAVQTLRGFRGALYGCLTGWAYALFELSDAVLCSPGPVSSVPMLSLEPTFRRGHGSPYPALTRGSLDADRLRDTLVAHRPADWPAIFAVDASSWPRCDTETSPARGFYYHPSRHSNGQPIIAGWSYQWVTQLNWSADSWTAPLDAHQIPPTADTTDATAAQVRDLVARLTGPDDNTQHDNTAGAVPMFVFDAGYDPIALSHALADVRTAIVVRIRDDRVVYPDPALPAPGQLGRPRRHGARFGCADPTSWPGPDDELTATDSRYADRAGHRLARAAPSSGSRSSTCPSPPRGRRRRYGCGPPVPGRSTCTPAGGPTCAVSTSSTPTGSPKHAGLDHPGAAHPRTSRPLDLAHRHQLHPAAPGPHARRRPTPALGTAPRPRQTHPGPRPPRVSPTSHDHRPQPTHRNPPNPDPDGHKAPPPAPETATQRSRKQPDRKSRV